MGVELLGPGTYLPPTVLTNGFLEEIVDTSDTWIRERTGIYERRISLDKPVSDMCLSSAEDLIEKIGLKEKVNMVISATNFSADNRRFPMPAGYVAHNVGNSNAIAYDLTAGCTGLIFAISNAYNAIAAGQVNNAMAMGSERITDWTDFSDRDTCVLFGDGAGAYYLRRSDKEGIINIALGGQYDAGNEAEGFPDGVLTTIKKEGTKLKMEDGRLVTVPGIEQEYITMYGKGVFKFATKAMQKAIKAVLKGTGYTLADIDVIVPHGANQRIVDNADEAVRGRGFVDESSKERVRFKGVTYTNLAKIGNTSTASIPIAEAQAIQEGIIKKGHLVLKVGFGAGLTWGAILERKSGL